MPRKKVNVLSRLQKELSIVFLLFLYCFSLSPSLRLQIYFSVYEVIMVVHIHEILTMHMFFKMLYKGTVYVSVLSLTHDFKITFSFSFSSASTDTGFSFLTGVNCHLHLCAGTTVPCSTSSMGWSRNLASDTIALNSFSMSGVNVKPMEPCVWNKPGIRSGGRQLPLENKPPKCVKWPPMQSSMEVLLF